MLLFEEAKSIILQNIETLGTGLAPLTKSLGHVIAESMKVPFDLPLFDNSSVDGYGIKLADVSEANKDKPATLSLQAIVRAGDNNNVYVNSGCTAKILTGAPVPKSVDAVVMREYCEEKQGAVSIAYSPKYGENIRRQGEEFKKDEDILQAGTLITPPVIGLLATLGIDKISVYQKPKVAIMTTGDELVKPGRSLLPGKIYDSNSFALKAALQSLGIDQCLLYHAKENKKHTHKTISNALKHTDVIISAGGVSVGDYDYVKEVCEELGFETLIWKIAIKPGKPVYFGIKKSGNRHKVIFGLPGNPVSSLVTFHQLVKPALQKIMGMNSECFNRAKTIPAQLTASISKKPERMEFVRGKIIIENNLLKVCPTKGQESHMLSGLSNADCLIYFPVNQNKLSEGDLVDIELLNWNA